MAGPLALAFHLLSLPVGCISMCDLPIAWTIHDKFLILHQLTYYHILLTAPICSWCTAYILIWLLAFKRVIIRNVKPRFMSRHLCNYIWNANQSISVLYTVSWGFVSVLFWALGSQCSPGWLPALTLTISPSQVLGLQPKAAMPGACLSVCFGKVCLWSPHWPQPQSDAIAGLHCHTLSTGL